MYKEGEWSRAIASALAGHAGNGRTSFVNTHEQNAAVLLHAIESWLVSLLDLLAANLDEDSMYMSRLIDHRELTGIQLIKRLTGIHCNDLQTLS